MSTEPEPLNSGHPSNLQGIELIEYSTARPLALGHVLEPPREPAPAARAFPRSSKETP